MPLSVGLWRDTSPVAARGTFCALTASAAVLVGCSGHPDRVHVLGRDYDRGTSTPLTLTAVHEQAPSAVIVSHGKVVTGTPGAYAPTVIFVKDGSSYYEYALSGGP